MCRYPIWAISQGFLCFSFGWLVGFVCLFVCCFRALEDRQLGSGPKKTLDDRVCKPSMCPFHGCISLSVRGEDDLGPQGATLQTVLHGFPLFAELREVLEVGGLRVTWQGGWLRPLVWVASAPACALPDGRARLLSLLSIRPETLIAFGRGIELWLFAWVRRAIAGFLLTIRDPASRMGP